MKLTPITRKGRNKIAEAGTDQWHVIGTSPNVIAFNKPGILIMPTPVGLMSDLAYMRFREKARWVMLENDPDFSFDYTP